MKNVQLVSADYLVEKKRTKDLKENLHADHTIVVTTRSNQNGDIGACRNINRMAAAIKTAKQTISFVGNSSAIATTPLYIWHQILQSCNVYYDFKAEKCSISTEKLNEFSLEKAALPPAIHTSGNAFSGAKEVRELLSTANPDATPIIDSFRQLSTARQLPMGKLWSCILETMVNDNFSEEGCGNDPWIWQQWNYFQQQNLSSTNYTGTGSFKNANPSNNSIKNHNSAIQRSGSNYSPQNRNISKGNNVHQGTNAFQKGGKNFSERFNYSQQNQHQYPSSFRNAPSSNSYGKNNSYYNNYGGNSNFGNSMSKNLNYNTNSSTGDMNNSYRNYPSQTSISTTASSWNGTVSNSNTNLNNWYNHQNTSTNSICSPDQAQADWSNSNGTSNWWPISAPTNLGVSHNSQENIHFPSTHWQGISENVENIHQAQFLLENMMMGNNSGSPVLVAQPGSPTWTSGSTPFSAYMSSPLTPGQQVAGLENHSLHRTSDNENPSGSPTLVFADNSWNIPTMTDNFQDLFGSSEELDDEYAIAKQKVKQQNEERLKKQLIKQNMMPAHGKNAGTSAPGNSLIDDFELFPETSYSANNTSTQYIHLSTLSNTEREERQRRDSGSDDDLFLL